MKIKNRLGLAKYFRKLGYKRGAEIGVYDGRFSEILCQNIPDLKLVCIDTWTNNEIYEKAKKKLEKYNAELIRNSSKNAAPLIPNESLDFVFIDADHSYSAVKEDIHEWSQKVRKGGVVSGHDYYVFRYSGNRGVVDAVNEYVKEKGYQLLIIERDQSNICHDDKLPCWYFFKI